MNETLKQGQQLVTGVVPWLYVVVGVLLFLMDRHVVLLVFPLLLVALNPLTLQKVGFWKGWGRGHASIFTVQLWLASLGMIIFSGGIQSFLYPLALLIPIGYAAAFFSRAPFTFVVFCSLLAAAVIYMAAESRFSIFLFVTTFQFVDLILCVFIVALVRLLYGWTGDAKKFRRLSLRKRDRNNPHNQLRLNMLFVPVFAALLTIQAFRGIGAEVGFNFFAVAAVSVFVWMVINVMLRSHPEYASRPLTVLTLLAFCTACIYFSGFSHSALYPTLYLLVVVFISFNAEGHTGAGAALLSFVLTILLFWATPERAVEAHFRLVIYSSLFFFLPLVIGYAIRIQMQLLKEEPRGIQAADPL